MEKPKIRHLALFAKDTHELAKFYEEVFEMEITHVNGDAVFITDGYLTMALLPHSARGSSTRGLNHFGFKIDDMAEFSRRIEKFGIDGPEKRPADRPYAEQRCCDPEGNMFDLSVHGFQRVETNAERDNKAGEKVLA
jgi:predicted enzyme related to lactoylglutathione lyase